VENIMRSLCAKSWAFLPVVCLLFVLPVPTIGAPIIFAYPPPGADAILLYYDPGTGNVEVETTNDIQMTTLSILSTSGLFRPSEAAADVFLPPFDRITENKVFKLGTSGFSNVAFGPIIAPGNSPFLLSELDVDGSILPSGSLPPVYFPIPEPTAGWLLVIGSSVLVGRRRLDAVDYRNRRV
jgi:hypothetical protein